MNRSSLILCGVLAAALAACGDSGSTKTDGGVHDMAVADAAPSKAGSACTDDTMCGSSMALTCQSIDGISVCTADCMESKSSGTEVSECDGPGSTCLTNGDQSGSSSFCTKSCTAKVMGKGMTGCAPNQICTGFWANYASTPGKGDPVSGCLPFCHADGDCPSGMHCDRFGNCAMTAIDMTKLADGEPCKIPSSMTAPSPCRGGCFQTSNDKVNGICGSIVDTNKTIQCPDDPMMPLLAPATDNMGFCVFKGCTTNCDCPAGLICTAGGAGNLCDYPQMVDGGLDPGIACAADGGTKG